MPNHHTSTSEDAFARLALGLSEALMQFLAVHPAPKVKRPPKPCNDNEAVTQMALRRPDDPMTLAEVRCELRLKDKQVVALRRLWGFPPPWCDGEKLIFSRQAVARWARSQPNPQNLAAVLRLRRRRFARVAPGNAGNRSNQPDQ